MRNDELESVWLAVEQESRTAGNSFQRIVYVNLLYRAYIGASGLPSRRYLSLEVPQDKLDQVESFFTPRGFTLSIGEPAVKHVGYVSCILQAASADQNDVFTIVVKDILDELERQKLAENYINALKSRIAKWREFFKSASERKLSAEAEIGLFGELSFIRDMAERGFACVFDFWNGPIKSAQDFQGNKVAIEVKTSSSRELEHVYISSEVQLDKGNYSELFLSIYRVERDDTSGISLPELIDAVASNMAEQQRNRFYALLLCLGYTNDDASYYKKKYCIKEQRTFCVEDSFPRITCRDLPKGVGDVHYALYLDSAAPFAADMDAIGCAIKEYEYGSD